MLTKPVADLPPLDTRSGRAEWVDIAKAISIILLVQWHVAGETSRFGQAMLPIRMPLFFFVAGLFMRAALKEPWPTFLSRKSGYFLWIYIVWSVLGYGLTLGLHDLFAPLATGWARLLRIAWEPPLTLWFIYALFWVSLAARLLRNWPGWALLLLALPGYVAAVGWYDAFEAEPSLQFLRQTLRLLPFFFLGLFAFEMTAWFVERARGWFWVPLALFTTIALLAAEPGHPALKVVVELTLSVLGVTGMLMLSHAIAPSRLGRFLAWLGTGTLFVFVLHRIPLYWYDQVTGWDDQLQARLTPAWADLLFMAVLVLGCVSAGRALERVPVVKDLFGTPWSRRRRPLMGEARSRAAPVLAE